MATAAPPAYSPGLEGVIAGETELSFVNPELKSLMYRGYDIRDLADNCCFEEVAYLMLHGNLPNKSQLDDFKAVLVKERALPSEVKEAMKAFPKTVHPMDSLRGAVALLALHDAEVTDGSHEANVRKAVRLLAKIPVIVANNHRLAEGMDWNNGDDSLGHGANFLFMLNGQAPDAETAKLFDYKLLI